jgi:hypothetical protein
LQQNSLLNAEIARELERAEVEKQAHRPGRAFLQRRIERTAVAFEAGRDGFWLAPNVSTLITAVTRSKAPETIAKPTGSKLVKGAAESGDLFGGSRRKIAKKIADHRPS